MPDRAPDPKAKRSRPRRNSRRAGDADALAKKLDITLHRPQLLRQALTHKSAEQEMSLPSNERLEFLGDSVLDLVVAQYLYRSHPELAEGDLTKLKSVAVAEPALAAAARNIGLGPYLLLAKGEEQTGGRDRNSILADAMEAIFAAVYLDRGLRMTRSFILNLLADQLEVIERREHEPDYKTLLQEKIQEIHRTPPTYRVVSQSGPDHDRTFVAEVRIGREVLGSGRGKSKKQAEQAAARQALAAGE